MSTQVPRLLTGLVDDAAVFPPGSASLPDAVAAHRAHRDSWYADLVGPLLLPASRLAELAGLLHPDERLAVGVINDLPLDQLAKACAAADERLVIRQVEAAVARRGEDPLPGLTTLIDLAREDPPRGADLSPGRDSTPDSAHGGPADSAHGGPADSAHGGPAESAPGGGPADAGPARVAWYAEIPLTFGLTAALDAVAAARADGVPVAAKFRTGGLAAELFPTPAELAAVICACRDRDLPFKLTAGLHHATRHLDPETGFTHHGFGNVLVAALAAAQGAEPAEVTVPLAATAPRPLAELAASARADERPLWVGFGSCSILEPLTDLIRLGLVDGGFEA